MAGFISTSGGSGRVKLGPEIQSLGLSLTTTPLDRLRPLTQKIADAPGETVDLAVLRNGKMLFVDQIEGRQRLRTVSSIGETFPWSTTANGKAALACLDKIEATNLPARELRTDKSTEETISALLMEIEAIRDGARARDEDKHTDGISALGFGVTQANGEIFALSVPVPSRQFRKIRASRSQPSRPRARIWRPYSAPQRVAITPRASAARGRGPRPSTSPHAPSRAPWPA